MGKESLLAGDFVCEWTFVVLSSQHDLTSGPFPGIFVRVLCRPRRTALSPSSRITRQIEDMDEGPEPEIGVSLTEKSLDAKGAAW